MNQKDNDNFLKGVSDETGKILENDNDDQADMCEFIRTAYFSGEFGSEGDQTQNIKLPLIKQGLHCAGNPNTSLTNPCALNANSYLDPYDWTILVSG